MNGSGWVYCASCPLWVKKREEELDTGLVHIPFDRPTRTARQTFDWAYENAIHADQSGMTEMMIAEHATQAWECIPNPELVIAAAARDTENIKFAPMAHLLAYHNAATLS